MAQAPQPPDDEREFNTPAEMLARAANLAGLVSLPVGLLLTLAGALSHRLAFVLGGVVALALGATIRGWLRRRRPAVVVAHTFGAGAREETSDREVQMARLIARLREWDAQERRRGSPAFDPWALQAARNDVLALIEDDPALASLLRIDRRAA